MLRKFGVVTHDDKLAIDRDRVAQFVMDRARAGQVMLPPIDDVLEAWLSLFGSQLGHASARRVPFVPHDDIEPVMDALAALGYAEPLGNAFIWTDKISHAMRMSGLWDENRLSREELEEREIDLEMRKALASIPEDVRHSSLRNDQIAVVRALATRWIDGVWLSDSVDEAPWWRLTAVGAKAKRLAELIEDTGDPRTRDAN
jgi:hypothetical protein